MSVRAKFRCTSITLSRVSTVRPGLTYEAPKRAYVDSEGNVLPAEGTYHQWDQPSVTLMAVADGSEENKKFFTATPAAQLTMTMSNPDAAETFELGKSYYVDFTLAQD